MIEYKPVYRVTVELLNPLLSQSWEHDVIGLYCFDAGRRPLEMTTIDARQSRFSFDLQTRAMGLYVASPGMAFACGPWYQSPTRKAVEGDI